MSLISVEEGDFLAVLAIDSAKMLFYWLFLIKKAKHLSFKNGSVIQVAKR